jgi:hypothetical protein
MPGVADLQAAMLRAKAEVARAPCAAAFIVMSSHPVKVSGS